MTTKGGRSTIVFWCVTVALFAIPVGQYVQRRWSEPGFQPVQAISPSPPAWVGLQVDVKGAVHQPGVYTVQVGTKVHQLLSQLALFPDATTDHLNLAATLRDGQKVVIKRVKPSTQAMVNVNMASAKVLATLTGVGPRKASKIIQYRQERGRIQHATELATLIGASTVTKNRHRLLY